MQKPSITRTVSVRRNVTPEQMFIMNRRFIDFPGYIELDDKKSAIECMPVEGRDKEKVIFFKIDKWCRYDPSAFVSYVVVKENIVAEYERLGLKPDPYAQVAVNRRYPKLIKEHPNCSWWKGPNDRWHYLFFHTPESPGEIGKGAHLHVESYMDFISSWWFTGVPK